MAKPKIFLLGERCKRTPTAYNVYRPLFDQYLDYVDYMPSADFVIMGCAKTIEEHSTELKNSLQKNITQRLVVLSEEPYWDLVPNNKVFDKYNQKVINGFTFEFVSLNYTNTDIFEFRHIPYFLTTEDDYLNRYQLLLAQKHQLSAFDIRQRWQQASYPYAFVAEKRENQRYQAASPKLGLLD